MKHLITVILALILTACSTPTHVQTSESQPISGNTVVLTVYGMSCPLCSNNLDGQLDKIEGVDSMNIDLDTGAVTVQLAEEHTVTQQQLAGAVKAAGFTLADIEAK
ncbi:heavy-metal-associated domain-containing protein [Pontiellaceae bacterium B12227]|nr:heavy-metal-associated domain-containing protein [Pontiellaceae bacterium B12227]